MLTTAAAGNEGGAASNEVAAVAPAVPQQRLFERLDAVSKEKVTMLLSHYQKFLPSEKIAFMQELAQLNVDEEAAAIARAKLGERWERYTTPRLQAVQAREAGYVQALVPQGAAADDFNDEAYAPCTLEDLLQARGMFDEKEGVDIRVSKISLYDKLRQTMNKRQSSVKGAEAEAAATRATQHFDTTTPSTKEENPGSNAAQRGALPTTEPVRSVDSGNDVVVLANGRDVAANPPLASAAPYRNNAYQAVRLAMSSPAYIAVQPPASQADEQTAWDGKRSVLNVTGLPIEEEDLRAWFAELDNDQRGVIGLEEFLQHVESLERTYGAHAAYEKLASDGARLAQNGMLTFEAFAYLVLRFLRE